METENFALKSGLIWSEIGNEFDSDIFRRNLTYAYI